MSECSSSHGEQRNAVHLTEVSAPTTMDPSSLLERLDSASTPLEQIGGPGVSAQREAMDGNGEAAALGGNSASDSNIERTLLRSHNAISHAGLPGSEEQHLPSSGLSGDSTDPSNDHSSIVEAWRAAGRPNCPVCDKFHPPPCDPKRAKQAIRDKKFKERDPQGYKQHQNFLKRQRQKQRKAERDEVRGQGAGAARPLTMHQEPTTPNPPPPPPPAPQSDLEVELIQSMALSLVRSLEPNGFQKAMADARVMSVPGLREFLTEEARKAEEQKASGANPSPPTEAQWQIDD